MNSYAQNLINLQQKPTHVLKDIGDQWQTPKSLAFGLFWHFTPKIGPIVLDLFASEANKLADNFYTAEINAMTQDWAGDLKRFGGAAFANPPYSRPFLDEDGTPITGIDHVLQYCREQREHGAKIMLLLKAATSDGWWPEDADFIQFISGRIGFKEPSWYVPRDPKKDKPSSSGFASAVIIFDKEWGWERRPTERLSRHLLETQGQIIIGMIESRAAVIAAEMNSQFVPGVIEETTAEPEREVDIEDDNYHLDLVDEEPKEDYSDKTIEQIYAMVDSSQLLLIVMLTILFGKKTEYSHREIQFALTSLLTNGETTNAEIQHSDAVAIDLAMKEFLRKHEATLQQQHDLVYVMFIHCLRPSSEPLYQNVKTLIKINNAFSKNSDIDTVIDQLETEQDVATEQTNESTDETTVAHSFPEGSSELKEHPGTGEVMTELVCDADGSLSPVITDEQPSNEPVSVNSAPALTKEYIDEKFTGNKHYDELEEFKPEFVARFIQVMHEMNYELNKQYSELDSLIETFKQNAADVRAFLNIRVLRAVFRDCTKPVLAEVSNV